MQSEDRKEVNEVKMIQKQSGYKRNVMKMFAGIDFGWINTKEYLTSVSRIFFSNV